MKESGVGRVRIHECRHCRGIWFNRGELNAVKDEILPDLGWMDIWQHKAEFKASANPMMCPKCSQMALVTLNDRRSGTEISFCNQCKGIWLDADQFCNIVDRLIEQADQQSVPDYIRASLHQAKEMITNPEAIMSEWKDLKSVLKLLNYRILAEHPTIESVIAGLQKSIPT
jgi:Zn-finger nucleic acid-binding protein